MADNNSPENLVFKLIADTKEFAAGIKKALDDGLKMIQDYQKKASASLGKTTVNAQTKQAQEEFSRLTVALEKAKKEFLSLANSALGWQKASQLAGATSKETAGLYDKLTDSAARQKITIQQAAIAAIESGQAQVKAIQDVLYHNKQKVVSEKAVSDAINVLSDNLKKAETIQAGYAQKTNQSSNANKNLAGITNDLTIAFKNFGSIALTVLGINGILGAIQKVIDLFSGAATAAINYAQAQFGLMVAVRAANIESNGQAGTLKEWQERIQKLRKELVIYSETDVTKAVSRVAGLTRAFGLNAEQQERLIKVSNVLAASIGVDLSQGLQDVVQYMGGSSVVLDKYNLAIRDTDKAAAAFQLGFTEKLQRGTNGLTSQQLALASLETLFTEAGSLVEAFGEYQETLPGQIKEVDASIADQTLKLGTAFDQTILGMKLVYSAFLQFLIDLAESPVFKVITDNLKPIIDYLLLKERLDQSGITELKQPRDFGLKINPAVAPGPFGFGSGSQVNPAGNYDPLNINSKGKWYTADQLTGDKENVDAYIAYIKSKQEGLSDIAGLYSPGDGTRAFKEAGFSRGGGGGDDDENDEKFVEAQQKLGQELVDNFNSMVKDQRDALLQRNADIRDANEDYTDALEDLGIETTRKLEDLEDELGYKRGDTVRKYFDDLEELEADGGDKRREVIEETNRKTEEIWEDYYAKLRELDNQYFFDLRDAVAENDAVAIKRLERKFALDKEKINAGLQDRLNDEEKSSDKRLQEIELETKNRAGELKRRFDAEMVMINVDGARKRDEIRKDHEREIADLNFSLQRKSDAIEESYQEELDMIELHYQDRLTEITRKLAEEFTLEKGSLRKLFTLYDEYYGGGGKLYEMMDEFYEHQNELAGEFNDSIGDLDKTGKDRNVKVTTTNSGSQMTVTISGDGTISDSTVEKLAEEIAERISDSIETIVVQRGGGSGRK